MSNLVRQPTGQNYGPVGAHLVYRVEPGQPDVVEGVEITFNEYAPDMRNRVKFYLLFLILLLAMGGTICLVITGWFYIPEWISWWEGAPIRPDQFLYSAFMVVSGVVFVSLWPILRPPFKAPVRVFMSPGDNLVSIYRAGKLAENVTLREVRSVNVDPHPMLEDALVSAEADPKNTRFRALVNRYKLVRVIFLELGVGVTTMKTEVASFRVSAASNLPMQARAAVEMGVQLAIDLQNQAAGQGPIQPASPTQDMDVPAPGDGPPKRRRRRSKTE